MKIIAIVPARSGSVRLPKKNRRTIRGKTLVEITIDYIKKVKIFNDILLTTDDKFFIRKYSNSKSIKLITRPTTLATSSSKVIYTILHAIKFYENNIGKIDITVVMQPTSPIRSIKILKNLLKKLKKKRDMPISYVSVSKRLFSCNEKNFLIKKKRLYEIKKNFYKNQKTYQLNGNFYVSPTKIIKKFKQLYLLKNTIPVVLKDKKMSVDINDYRDFDLAQKYYKG